MLVPILSIHNKQNNPCCQTVHHWMHAWSNWNGWMETGPLKHANWNRWMIVIRISYDVGGAGVDADVSCDQQLPNKRVCCGQAKKPPFHEIPWAKGPNGSCILLQCDLSLWNICFQRGACHKLEETDKQRKMREVEERLLIYHLST